MLPDLAITPLPQKKKKPLRTLCETITNHSLIGSHLGQWNDFITRFCRLCEENVESFYHLVQECPVLTALRTQIFQEYPDTLAGYKNKALAMSLLPQVLNLITLNAEAMLAAT